MGFPGLQLPGLEQAAPTPTAKGSQPGKTRQKTE